MAMPIVLMAHDHSLTSQQIEKVFNVFKSADQKYSPYRHDSEVSRLQNVSLLRRRYTAELASILVLAEQTKRETDGYFNVEHDGVFDPSGIVKGWAIQKAVELLECFADNFYMEAGGDIQVRGVNEEGKPWRIGIRNPFDRSENVSVVSLNNKAIATSGTAIRGTHIYDPVNNNDLNDIVSLSVVAPLVIDADRMATAAFAMGKNGIYFLEKLNGFEGYMINNEGIATQTSGWGTYEVAS